MSLGIFSHRLAQLQFLVTSHYAPVRILSYRMFSGLLDLLILGLTSFAYQHMHVGGMVDVHALYLT